MAKVLCVLYDDPVDVSGELGLRKFLEAQGHKLVVTSDKDGANSTGGELAGTGAHSYSAGNATAGSDEAARFKK
jgi:hypothetical protein